MAGYHTDIPTLSPPVSIQPPAPECLDSLVLTHTSTGCCDPGTPPWPWRHPSLIFMCLAVDVPSLLEAQESAAGIPMSLLLQGERFLDYPGTTVYPRLYRQPVCLFITLRSVSPFDEWFDTKERI